LADRLIRVDYVVAVNVWLLPIMGSVGAALAFIIAGIFGALCGGIFLWSKMRLVTAQEAVLD
jgi:Na+-driven multidrug efflux pump